MNWSDPTKRKEWDGELRLPPGWIDCWLKLHQGDPGFTYDGKLNAMLTGYLRRRLDRVFAKGSDFVLRSIEMVGTEPIGDAT